MTRDNLHHPKKKCVSNLRNLNVGLASGIGSTSKSITFIHHFGWSNPSFLFGFPNISSSVSYQAIKRLNSSILEAFLWQNHHLSDGIPLVFDGEISSRGSGLEGPFPLGMARQSGGEARGHGASLVKRASGRIPTGFSGGAQQNWKRKTWFNQIIMWIRMLAMKTRVFGSFWSFYRVGASEDGDISTKQSHKSRVNLRITDSSNTRISRIGS